MARTKGKFSKSDLHYYKSLLMRKKKGKKKNIKQKGGRLPDRKNQALLIAKLKKSALCRHFGFLSNFCSGVPQCRSITAASSATSKELAALREVLCNLISIVRANPGKINPKIIGVLNKYSSEIKLLIGNENQPLSSQRLHLQQNGGFLPLLLPLLGSVVAPVAKKIIKGVLRK